MSAPINRELQIAGKLYRANFGADGQISHIETIRRKRGGRTAWVWTWPRGARKGDTPTSRLVKDELARLAGIKAGQR